MKWTEEQSQAINEKGANILVAAAAGSGKTAVLVERIIKKEIDSIIKSGNVEEYRLFMLCFLLLDIDLEDNKEYIRIAMQYVKMNVLKYAIVVKLNYYLAFNAGDNKSMQNMLSQNIQRARINLDNTTSLSDIEQQIQMRKRENLINQNK